MMLHRLWSITSALLCVAAAMSFLLGCAEVLFLGQEDQRRVGPVTTLYYTTDDGKTWFVDKADRIAPFQKDGKEAVRAYLYTCDEEKTVFVGYLERLSPASRKRYEELQAKGDDLDAMAEMEMLAMNETEVKKPGKGEWVRRATEQGEEVAHITCPDGGGELQIVLPDE